jgi:biopolymer transport protein ExbD
MKKLMLAMALFVVAPVVKSQENPFLVPERANMRINAAVQIAKQLKERGYDKIAVVYMNTSDVCWQA